MANNHSTLTGLFADIADAIRVKTGGTESIVADAFPEAISMIEPGGGTDVEDALIARTISGAYSNDRVTEVGYCAFATCSGLTEVNFPAATHARVSAFASCYSLAGVNFPVLSTMGSCMFLDCRSLTEVNFPKANFAPVSAFARCANLTDADFPAATTISSSAFAYCYSLTSVNFPKAKTIGSYAFTNCSILAEVDFPAATTISNYAFQSCRNLVSLTLGATTVCKLGASNAFSSTPIGGYSASAGQYGTIYVPMSLLASYKTASNWSYFSSRFAGIQTNPDEIDPI